MKPSSRSRIQTMLFDPLWVGATDAEIAWRLDVTEALVSEARESFMRFAEVTAAVSQARRVAQATGYTGRVWSLISDALTEYGNERETCGHQSRGKP